MLFKRKKKTDDTQLHIESIPDESTKGFNVVEICEQMVDAARELEDNRTEYALVTNYLTDIERMENMSETDKKTMNDAAANILTLEKTRSDFLKTKNRISDSQYAQMQQLEDEIPRAIKRLEKNESSLDVINKDLRYLEGEKVQFDIDGEYAKSRQRAFRVYAVLLVVFFCCSGSCMHADADCIWSRYHYLYAYRGTSFSGCRLVCAFDISKLFR